MNVTGSAANAIVAQHSSLESLLRNPTTPPSRVSSPRHSTGSRTKTWMKTRASHTEESCLRQTPTRPRRIPLKPIGNASRMRGKRQKKTGSRSKPSCMPGKNHRNTRNRQGRRARSSVSTLAAGRSIHGTPHPIPKNTVRIGCFTYASSVLSI